MAREQQKPKTNATIICRIPATLDAVRQNVDTQREAFRIRKFASSAIGLLQAVHRPIRIATTLMMTDLLVCIAFDRNCVRFYMLCLFFVVGASERRCFECCIAIFLVLRRAIRLDF